MLHNDVGNDNAVAVEERSPDTTSRSGDVIVIGAGAAGLMAAYDLKRKGDFRVHVLEAHESQVGGRMRALRDFADVPMDLGGEFLHFPPKILQELVDDAEVDVMGATKTRSFFLAPFHQYRKRGGWRLLWNTSDEKEVLWKFEDSTWHDFFAKYIVPSIQDDIHLGCVVCNIDYSISGQAGVTVTCEDGRVFQAAQVIVTVALPILQQKKIVFNPPLPAKKQRAIENVSFDPGMKVFLEFSEKFYFQFFGIHKKYKRRRGEMYFYDESALNSVANRNRNILGIFICGDVAQKYVCMDNEEVLQALLQELDEAYNGRATRYYMKGFVQNWTTEPHVLGTYSSYRNGMGPMMEILQPVDYQVFFAGEHLPVNGVDYGYVTGAALSGRSAANAVLCAREGKKPPFPWRVWLVSKVVGTLCCGFENFLFVQVLNY